LFVPVSLRFREVSRTVELRLSEAIENSLEGDWLVIVSRSHLDGQWHLQLEGAVDRWRVVLPSFEDETLEQLSELLAYLSSAEGQVDLPFGPAGQRQAGNIIAISA
jgi:hypothetical protein